MSATIRTRRWTRIEYERLIDRGVFRDDERLELLDGLLVVKEPQGAPHAATVDLVQAALREVFGTGWIVRPHAPLALGRDSRPEPDISVVPGVPGDYRTRVPTHAVLVVEIAESSLRLDRTRKSSIYARAGITDYWIVNLVDGVLEVHRDPIISAIRRPRSYGSLQILDRDASIEPLAAPGRRVAVSDLLG